MRHKLKDKLKGNWWMLNSGKVIFILPGIRGGGAERVVLNLYKALELYLGCQCHIIALKKEVEHNINGFRVHFIDELAKVKKNGMHRLTYRIKMALIIDQYIDDNIGSDSFILSNMISSDKVMSQSRHRVLHIMHSEYQKAFLEGKPLVRQFFIKRNIEKIYKNKPMSFVSQGARDSFVNNFNVIGNKYVIYNPIDNNEIMRLANEESEKIDHKYIVHVGRFNRAKRHDLLLNAFALTKTDSKLVLFGSGKLEKQIKQQIIDLNIQNRVIIAGFKSNPYPYLKASKGLVLTSDSEGLGMVLLEAQILGIPMLSTDCSAGVREVVGDDYAGLMPIDNPVAIASFIDDMLANPSKYIQPIKNDFEPKKIAMQYDQLKISLIKNWPCK